LRGCGSKVKSGGCGRWALPFSRFLSQTMGYLFGDINPMIDGVRQVGPLLWFGAPGPGQVLMMAPKLSKAIPGARMVRSPYY
jgi:hypothetical protein